MTRRRRGSNLIEMLVFISALSMMLMLIGTLLHQMLRLDRAERARLVAASAVERFGHDLRADAHAAIGPIERAADRVVIPLPEGRSAEYRVGDSAIVRTVRERGKERAHETYVRPAGVRPTFESGERAAVVLRFETDPARPGSPLYRGYRIEAIPGRDAATTGRKAVRP